MNFPFRVYVLLSVVVVGVCCGCSPLRVKPVSERTYTFTDSGRYIDVAYGRPNAVLEKAHSVKDSITSKLPKLPMTQSQPQSPSIQEAVNSSVEFLARNQMQDVKVRVNEYDPKHEFERLKANRRIAAPLKYTLGLKRLAEYAISPGPLLKRDSYNPYTDTLHLNSGNPTRAIEQAAYAKDLRNRKTPNLYLLSQQAPGLEMPGILYTKNEVVNYYAMYGTPTQQQQATNAMTERLATQVGSEVGDFFPGVGPTFSIAGNLVGKAIAAKQRLTKR